MNVASPWDEVVALAFSPSVGGSGTKKCGGSDGGNDIQTFDGTGESAKKIGGGEARRSFFRLFSQFWLFCQTTSLRFSGNLYAETT